MSKRGLDLDSSLFRLGPAVRGALAGTSPRPVKSSHSLQSVCPSHIAYFIIPTLTAVSTEFSALVPVFGGFDSQALFVEGVAHIGSHFGRGRGRGQRRQFGLRGEIPRRAATGGPGLAQRLPGSDLGIVSGQALIADFGLYGWLCAAGHLAQHLRRGGFGIGLGQAPPSKSPRFRLDYPIPFRYSR